MNYYSETRKYGLLAGLGMIIYLAILGSFGDFGGSFYKFLKYLFIAGALYMFFSRYKPSDAVKRYIAYHINHGAIISFYAAAVTVIGNAILFMINPEISTAKFNLIPTDSSSLVMVSVILFVEIFVLGMLCTFVIFPIFKPRRQELREDE